MTETTIQSLAAEMSRAFTGGERINGERFRMLEDGSPQWMKDVVYHAHGSLLPDDWRFEFVERSVDALAETDNEDAALEYLRESGVSVYTNELTGWLASNNWRHQYVDDAVQEIGLGDETDTITRIGWGQFTELQEVFRLVVESLNERLEEIDEEDDD